jgi:hypothetical protein
LMCRLLVIAVSSFDRTFCWVVLRDKGGLLLVPSKCSTKCAARS